MEEIKVLVVEDEMIIADIIINALEGFGYKPLEAAITYSEAIETIEETKPDIGIFDIQLSGRKTGIDLARTVNEKYNFPFLFLTSFSDKNTLNEAKEVHPSAFLVKPFNKEELKVAIELALYNYSLQKAKPVEALNNVLKESIFIKKGSKQMRIKICEIMYIKSDNVYIDLYMSNGDIHTLRETISDYIKKLTPNFVKCHRSYIINLKHVESVQKNSITVKDTDIPMSKNMREEIINKLSDE
jgi:DNA-binding LytR/AlgR family response regulator